MMRLPRAVRRLLVPLAVALLGACGGGDDERLLPPLSQDSVPTGARIDVSTLNLFPNGGADQWVYERIPALGPDALVTRTAISGPDINGFVVLRETDAEGSTDIQQRLTNAGLEQRDLLGAEGVWPGAFAALPLYLEYPAPLYPVGGERRTLRQGSLGADIDGDGLHDDFRVEIVQIFRGFEEMQLFGQTVDAAHFGNVLAFTTAATRNGAFYTTTSTEEAYFVGNVGLVRTDRSAIGSDGRVYVAPYSLRLRSATVAGQDYGDPAFESGASVAMARKPAGPVLKGAHARWLQEAAAQVQRRD